MYTAQGSNNCNKRRICCKQCDGFKNYARVLQWGRELLTQLLHLIPDSVCQLVSLLHRNLRQQGATAPQQQQGLITTGITCRKRRKHNDDGRKDVESFKEIYW